MFGENKTKANMSVAFIRLCSVEMNFVVAFELGVELFMLVGCVHKDLLTYPHEPLDFPHTLAFFNIKQMSVDTHTHTEREGEREIQRVAPSSVVCRLSRALFKAISNNIHLKIEVLRVAYTTHQHSHDGDKKKYNEVKTPRDRNCECKKERH